MAKKFNFFEYIGLKPTVYNEKEYEEYQMKKGITPDHYKEKEVMEMKVPKENQPKKKPKLLSIKKEDKNGKAKT